MPGDPKECRERALECVELARTANTPEHKQLLTNLAQSWIKLAVEIERENALLNEHGHALQADQPSTGESTTRARARRGAVFPKSSSAR